MEFICSFTFESLLCTGLSQPREQGNRLSPVASGSLCSLGEIRLESEEHRIYLVLKRKVGEEGGLSDVAVADA